MMTKTCEICGKSYQTKRAESHTCSRTCGALLRYQRTKQRTIEALVDKYIKPMEHVSYQDGYTNSRGSVQLHCSIWNETYSINVSDLRKSGITTCTACWKHRNDRTLHVHGDSRRVLVKLTERNRHRVLHWKQCSWCGSMYLASNPLSKYCSKRCINRRNRSIDTMKQTRRYKHARKNGRYENISLERLYKRDKGTCYLCGRHLVLNDDYNRPYAPTIEHVIPICKGGTNSWDNVRLACRACNVSKGTNIL